MSSVHRSWWLIASLCAPIALGLGVQKLSLRLDDRNLLHIAGPSIDILSGKPMERLKDGALVGFLGQLSISTDSNATVQARAIARFAVSYDIWEERFSVTRYSMSRVEEAPRKASHLSAQSAEAWCRDNLTIDASQFPLDQQIWVRLELRAEDPHEGARVVGDPGINLNRLIEIFSRPARAKQPVWQIDSGPIRLRDLRREG